MIKCNLCNNKEYEIIYDNAIRNGITGTKTKIRHKVVKCSSCGLVRLLENPLNIEYYQSDEYRSSYNNTTKANEYIQMHDNEQPPRLAKIGVNSFRNKIVLDYGCGGGAFLDLIKGLADKTIGIEPYAGYHKSLKNRCHIVFPSSKKAKLEYKNKIDTIVSFGVLEHVEDPSEYLKDAFSMLKKGGKMYIETDNLDDILMKLGVSSFDKFFYRTAHLWYFDAITLKKITEKAGFSNIKTSFRHNFDLSNTIVWLRDNKPTGNGKINLFNKEINNNWINFLEEEGLADLVCAEISK